MSDLEDLDDIEITGVEDHPPDTSVRLWGPPGCGKTVQSAARVGRLVRDHGYDVADVAWATYRKSLAMDTLKRLVRWELIEASQLDEPAKGPTRYIGTTHAIANRTMDDLPAPADTGDRIDFCDKRDIRYASKRPWEDGIGEQLFDGFSWLKSNRLDPGSREDIRRWDGYRDLRERWDGDMTAVWRDWQDYKAQRDLIDYYEMLEQPLLAGAAPPCPVLVLDEYHDATPLMAALSEMWIEAADIVIVAGDPNQVVNAYDGADPAFFERLDIPKVLLDRTYRVPEQVWRLATTMLSHAHTPPPVERISEGYIDEYRSPNFQYDHTHRGWESPAPGATAGPVWLRNQHDGGMLFLTRTRMQAAGVTHALDKAGIIYASQSELPGWNPGSTRLRLHNALQQTSKVAAGDFDTSGGGLTNYATSDHDPKRLRLPVETAVELLDHTNAQYLAQTRKETDEIATDLRSTVSHVSLAELDEHVTEEFWQTHTAGGASVPRLNQRDLGDRDRAALRAALSRYDDQVRPADVETEVLTIHASKGKGAANVVVYDGTSPRAASEMQASERARANEFRTWYVALTRASERLCIMRGAFEWTVTVLPEHLAAVVESGGGAHDHTGTNTNEHDAQPGD